MHISRTNLVQLKVTLLLVMRLVVTQPTIHICVAEQSSDIPHSTSFEDFLQFVV